MLKFEALPSKLTHTSGDSTVHRQGTNFTFALTHLDFKQTLHMLQPVLELETILAINTNPIFVPGKTCPICSHPSQYETETHFLLQCPEYDIIRSKLFLQLHRSLTSNNLTHVWSDLMTADFDLRTFYLIQPSDNL